MNYEVDSCSLHFLFQILLQKSVGYHREDVYDLFPGVFATVEMIPDSVGVWLLHCHVNDHMTGGMEALYTVHGKYYGMRNTCIDNNCFNKVNFVCVKSEFIGHLRKLSKSWKSSWTRSMYPKSLVRLSKWNRNPGKSWNLINTFESYEPLRPLVTTELESS